MLALVAVACRIDLSGKFLCKRQPEQAWQAMVCALLNNYYYESFFTLKCLYWILSAVEKGERRSVGSLARLGHIFQRRTGFATLDRLLERLHTGHPPQGQRYYPQ